MKYTSEINRAALLLAGDSGCIECCFDSQDTLLIRGSAGMELTLDFLSSSGPYDLFTASPGMAAHMKWPTVSRTTAAS